MWINREEKTEQGAGKVEKNRRMDKIKSRKEHKKEHIKENMRTDF